MTSSRNNTQRIHGFSLLELTVVLAIVGLLLGGLLSSLSTAAENRRRTDANAMLKTVEEALYGFAQAHGRLPCPATTTSGGAEDYDTSGIEGDCDVWHGFLPTRTLGLQGGINTEGLLTDPWLRPYLYSVSALVVSSEFAFTTEAGMKALFEDVTPLASGNVDLLCVAGAVDCNPPISSDTVPALVMTYGGNWPWLVGPPPTASLIEVENAGATTGGFQIPLDNHFVSTDFSDDNFDDILMWISPNVLFSRLVSVGKLP